MFDHRNETHCTQCGKYFVAAFFLSGWRSISPFDIREANFYTDASKKNALHNLNSYISNVT